MAENFNIEELEKQCLEAEKAYSILCGQLAQAKKREEETRKLKLEEEKQKRYEEVVEAYNNFIDLKAKFVEDYDSFIYKSTNDGHRNISDWVFESLGWF